MKKLILGIVMAFVGTIHSAQAQFFSPGSFADMGLIEDICPRLDTFKKLVLQFNQDGRDVLKECRALRKAEKESRKASKKTKKIDKVSIEPAVNSESKPSSLDGK